jgi:hypothetical protein
MNDLQPSPDILTIAHKFQIARMVDEGMNLADIVAGVAVEAYAHELAWQRMTESDR